LFQPLPFRLTLLVVRHLLLKFTFIGSETPTFRARIYWQRNACF